MSNPCIGVFLFIVILIQAPNTTPQEWRQIIPMKTTRTDVERLLGPPSRGSGSYDLKEGSLSIEYSVGPCRAGRIGGWNVPKDVVISVDFVPERGQLLTDLRLDRKKFRKKIDTHVIGITYYINDQEGVMYEIQEGRVVVVTYFPPVKYKHLYCGDSPYKEPSN